MAIVPDARGKEAFSTFHTLERFNEHTLLEVLPETGRTHQIRVHLAFLGCPVVGDRVYGKKRPSLPVEHHLLHAAQLSIKIAEGGEPRTFTARLPHDFEDALQLLRAK